MDFKKKKKKKVRAIYFIGLNNITRGEKVSKPNIQCCVAWQQYLKMKLKV